jgi:hypothetical protein
MLTIACVTNSFWAEKNSASIMPKLGIQSAISRVGKPPNRVTTFGAKGEHEDAVFPSLVFARQFLRCFDMAESIAELKNELVLLEKRLSRICQVPDMDQAVTECANKIAALREKIKKAEAE